MLGTSRTVPRDCFSGQKNSEKQSLRTVRDVEFHSSSWDVEVLGSQEAVAQTPSSRSFSLRACPFFICGCPGDRAQSRKAP